MFGSLLNPDTPHWGWVDLDVQLGSFERMFPWDLAPSFDVIMAGWPTGINNPVQVRIMFASSMAVKVIDSRYSCPDI